MLRTYPFTTLCVVLVWYLCLIKPPSLSVTIFDGFDKIVHMSMYLGTCGIFWTEYFRARHRLQRAVLLLVGVVAPIFMSGLIELAQENFTTCRSGEWADFAANTVGVLVAFVAAAVYRHKRLRRK